MDEYKWLIDALRPECDKVIMSSSNYDLDHGLGCCWGQGEARVRRAIIVLEDGKPVLNNAIAAGRTTREAVIADILSARPKDWVSSLKH